VRAAHYSAVLNTTNVNMSINSQERKAVESSRWKRDDSPSPPSRKQPFLLFDTKVGVDAFQHHAGGDLGEFFGLDFVEASAVDAALRNQLAGLNAF
jgi:hypothetical protein